MKRTLSIGLGLLLVISTIGITVNKHYSGEKLFSLSIYLEADPCCEMICNCCYEETATYRITDKFISPSNEFVNLTPAKSMAFSIAKSTADVFSLQKDNAGLKQDKPPPNCNISQQHNQAFLL